jgi:hypothetical protein
MPARTPAPIWEPQATGLLATAAIQLRNNGHPVMQDESSGRKTPPTSFFFTTGVDGDDFQPRMLSGNAQVPLAKAERTIARNYSDFSQREIDPTFCPRRVTGVGKIELNVYR